MYLARHWSTQGSLLLEYGLVRHFSKQLSVTLFTSSVALATASSCAICDLTLSVTELAAVELTVCCWEGVAPPKIEVNI